MANTEVERHTGVDVEDVPSAEWGWSKENYRLIHIGGLLSATLLTLLVLPALYAWLEGKSASRRRDSTLTPGSLDDQPLRSAAE